MPIAGAIPYALPTTARGSKGPLVYLPPGEPISAANARGKIVLRDFPPTTAPYALLLALQENGTVGLLALARYFSRQAPSLPAVHVRVRVRDRASPSL